VRSPAENTGSAIDWLVPSRVLLIEDDHALGAQIVALLRGDGLTTEWWTEGRPLEDEAERFSLLILDLMLPGTYGLQILRELRAASPLPVIVLTARGDTADKVRAFDLGADDYLTKPFWPRELLLRARARLRRPGLAGTADLSFGPLRLDPHRSAVQIGEAPFVSLTRAELAVLRALVQRHGEPVTRDWLVEHALGQDPEAGSRALDVHVSHLRRKLGDAGWIETVWGIGYRLAAGAGPARRP
jgi:DNA-binding response OmpR family regulator